MSFGIQQAKTVERKTLATGVAGSAVGILGFTFMGEFITSAFKLTGAQKLLASAATKIVLGAAILYAMGRSSGIVSLFLLAVGWSGLGSIAIDVVAYLQPTGGIFAVAESAASFVRGEADVTAKVEEAIRVRRTGLTTIGNRASSANQLERRITVVAE